MMAANLLTIAERGPALVYAHNAHLQRDTSTIRMAGSALEWWSAGAIVSAHLGEGYAFLATALGTIRHQGGDAPPPDTIEGLLYALPQEHYIVDARRLANCPRQRDARCREPLPSITDAQPGPAARSRRIAGPALLTPTRPPPDPTAHAQELPATRSFDSKWNAQVSTVD
jgi:hypothetical protein